MLNPILNLQSLHASEIVQGMHLPTGASGGGGSSSISSSSSSSNVNSLSSINCS